MNPTMTKDKICLDLSDVPELAEKLSRMEAGDSLTGSFKATLDEAKDGMAMLSIEEIKINAPKAKPDASKSTAVKMFSEEAEDGAKEEASAVAVE